MASIFHVVDRVRVKKNIPSGELTVGNMQNYSGAEGIITLVDTFAPSVDGFCYTVDGLPFYWDATALERVVGFHLEDEGDDISEAAFGNFFNEFKVV